MEPNQNQNTDLSRELLENTNFNLSKSQLSMYISNSQMRCQTYCENKLRTDLETKHEMHRDLTTDSLMALEK